MWDYKQFDSLDHGLWVVIEAWEGSRALYWTEGIEPGFVSFGILADELAEIALGATDDLTKPSELPAEGRFNRFAREDFSTIAELLSIDELRDPAKEYLQIELATRYCIDSEGMAERCLELVELILKVEPNLSVRRYLQRLSRAYIAGFFPEAVIMCRAVLDNAVRDVFQRKTQPLPETMAGRLDWAHMCGWLTHERRSEAWTVWTRGNKAVHEDPTVTGAVLDTIRMTLSVLNELYRSCEP